jgi:hypothetical protein
LISEKRGSYFGSYVSPVNTVFKDPQDFWLCDTDDLRFPELAVSRFFYAF